MPSKSNLLTIFALGAVLFLTGCTQGLLSGNTQGNSDTGATSNVTASNAQIKGLSGAFELGERIPGQFVVQLKEGVDQGSAIASLTSKVGGRAALTYSNAINGFLLQVPRADLQDSRDIVKQLENESKVKHASIDSVVKAHGQGIPPGIERINADQAANIDSVDQRVDADIAILDSGVDPTHPDIDVVRFKNCVGNRNTDGSGHGTHVAGTAAAIDNGQGVVGVAPGARVWSVKVLNDSGGGSFGTTGTVVCGIDFVTQHADQIDVANMSLGGLGIDTAQHSAIISSVQEGVFYAVSAGNDERDVFGSDNCFDENVPGCPFDPNQDTWDAIPAAYPEVATVSAMRDVDGERGAIASPGADDDVFADFTNFSRSNASGNPFSPFGPNPVSSPGAAIDVAAPGDDVLSTYKQAGLDVLSGTSMASPHVAGAAALYIAENGRDVNGDGTVNAQDVFAVRQALVDSGQPQSNWQSGSTGDPDANPEPLVQVGSFSPSLKTGPCPSDQTQPSQDATVGTDLECPAQNR